MPIHVSRRIRQAVVLGVLSAVLVTAAATSTGAVDAAKKAKSNHGANTQMLYVSLGDSYAAGYQPTGLHKGHTDTNGFAYQIPALATKKGYDFKLVNFGCGGATTTSILKSIGCSQLGPGAAPYPAQTQAAAAEAFLRAHQGKVGLITVSISGNDVTSCAASANPIPCVTAAITTIKANLSILLPAIRAAAGPSVPIIGITYPDVILGLDLSTSTTLENLAKLSVVAFQKLINPALAAEYAAVNGTLVDVTAATGGYGPLTTTTHLKPYGTIPLPVAKICELTYFCRYKDIHPRTAGYTIIAKLVVAALPEHRAAS